MTSLHSHRNFTALAAALLLGAAVLPAAAQTTSPGMQAAPPAQAPAAQNPAPAAKTPAPIAHEAARTQPDRVEARIKQLHARFHITAAQEDKWKDFADAMRSSASGTQTAIQERQSATNPTAVDDLQAYEKIVDTHADGLKKLVPAFSSLYDSMSDSQKKVADSVFGHGSNTRNAAKPAPSHS